MTQSLPPAAFSALPDEFCGNIKNVEKPSNSHLDQHC